jgi:hypothetical protein
MRDIWLLTVMLKAHNKKTDSTVRSTEASISSTRKRSVMERDDSDLAEPANSRVSG